MPQRMGGDPLLDTSQVSRVAADLLQRFRTHMCAGLAAWKQIVRRLLLLPVNAQYFEQALGQNAIAVLGSLAALDANQHPRGVDVAHLQIYGFRDPQPAAVANHQRRPVLEDADGDEEPLDLFGAEHHGQAVGRALALEVGVAPGQLQCLLI